MIRNLLAATLLIVSLTAATPDPRTEVLATVDDALRAINTQDDTLFRSVMLPAAVMAWGYHRLLQRLVARGFASRGARPKLTKGEKLSMALMALGLKRP